MVNVEFTEAEPVWRWSVAARSVTGASREISQPGTRDEVKRIPWGQMTSVVYYMTTTLEISGVVKKSPE